MACETAAPDKCSTGCHTHLHPFNYILRVIYAIKWISVHFVHHLRVQIESVVGSSGSAESSQTLWMGIWVCCQVSGRWGGGGGASQSRHIPEHSVVRRATQPPLAAEGANVVLNQPPFCMGGCRVSVLVGEQWQPEVIFMQIELICITRMNLICTPPHTNFALKQEVKQADKRWAKAITQYELQTVKM